eukprot:m.140710 g.140710  ORF g.140710 m.140710 type:complete len:76 (+) comp38324_c0_seq46:376-603(+)
MPCTALSRTQIDQEADEKNPSKYITFVRDQSSNGTYINGDKIGRNKTQVLNNNDEIGLSHAKNKPAIRQKTSRRL